MVHSIGNSTVDILQDTFVDVVRLRALHQPDKVAFSFLADRSEERTNITFSELDIQARNIASILQRKASNGDRAILLYPSGKDYITGLLGSLFAGIIAVPAYPPDPTRLNNTLKRLETIIENSQATVALTTSHIFSSIKKILDNKNNSANERIRKDQYELKILAEKMINSLTWIQTDICEKGNESYWKAPEINSDSIAYLQYTSGSTGRPNGVIITHKNILVNSQMIASAFELDGDHEGIIWLPMYHDMGLVGGILQPLYTGFKCTIMSPLSFLAWPSRWLKEISKCGDIPVISGGPNFAYELCTRRITSEQAASLDLSNWKLAFSGAEPVRWKTIEEFSEKFAPSGFRKEIFYPCYGLAEATLFVSGVKRSKGPVYLKLDKKSLGKHIVKEDQSSAENGSVTLVGCGYPRVDGVIAIVDPDTKRTCEKDSVGEVWFSSHTVAEGYWNKTQLSDLTFNNYLNQDTGKRYLRTGDLGFIKDGQLYITGRLKDLIIIRGKNHYPQDIEYTVEKSHNSIRQNCTAVFSIEKEKDESLVVVAEVTSDNNLNHEEICTNISTLISTEHDLQVGTIVLIKPKTILKTSSGKIQRNAIKDAFIKDQLEIIKLWNATDISIREDAFPEETVIEEDPKDDDIYGLPGVDKALQITNWIVSHLAGRLKVNSSQIDINKPFTSYGIDSVMAVELASELENYLGRKISSTIVWEYSTINKLVRSLNPESQQTSNTDITPVEYTDTPDQIAIIGMSCRFPGGVNNPDGFWGLLENGMDGISEVPSDRWNIDEFYNEDSDMPGKMSTRWGGFIKDIDKFDPKFFGISPREALQMDPQQRHLLEVFWEALENGAIPAEKLAGTRTGVFVGISNHDYSNFQYGNFDNIDVYTGTGSSFSIVPNRISYLFDLRGPSLAIDTACSSSLVAAHLACQSLQRKESDMAVVGGVNVVLCPDVNIALSKGHMLSPDGHCKTFDASANGYVRSEGCGVVILKRLSDALKDGNNILAVIKGSAINQDGHSNGLTAPNKMAQQEVIREALRNAHLSIDQVSYIETHGTGTILGDPIEVGAIHEVFKNRISNNPLVLGSVKSNIGHLESASGIAGLIKVVLMFNKKLIPANLNFRELNPHIDLTDSQLKIASQLQKWEVNGNVRIAGINSFGFGGVNAHILLEEYPQKSPKDNIIDRPSHILTISAKDEEALNFLAEKYQKKLLRNDDSSLADICYSANTGRSSLAYKLAVTGESNQAIASELKDYLDKKEPQRVYLGKTEQKARLKTAFLFTGQGAQYVNMAKLLYQTHPLFREIFDTCNTILKKYLDRPLSEVIFNDNEDSDEINDTAYTQPALFVIEYALAKLWISWGIKPDYLIGHSIGDYAAACIADVFSLEDALMLVSARGKLMQSLPKNGEMIAVFSDRDHVRKFIHGLEDKVSIAAVNGPANTVVSGEREVLKHVAKLLDESNIHSQFLKVSHAFHSPLMEPILDEFEAIAAKVQYAAPKIPVVSNLSGKMISENQMFDSRYWRNHIRNSVLFANGLDCLVKLGTDIFVEVGPHPTLIRMARSCVPESKALWVSSIKKGQDDWKTILHSLARLYAKGVEIDWHGFDHYYYRNSVSVPNYPFKKERYWTDGPSKTTSGVVLADRQLQEAKKITPLIQGRLFSPAIKEVVYIGKVQLKNFKLLDDHRILSVSLMPMAGFIEIISDVIRDIYSDKNFTIRNLNVLEAMIIPRDKICNIQVVLSKFVDSASTFQIYSSENSDSTQDVSWKLNATGEVLIEEVCAQLPAVSDINNLYRNYNLQMDINKFYHSLQSIGFEHGATYQVIRQIYSKDNEALAYCSLTEPSEAESYIIHPSLLDGGIQLFMAAFNGADVSKDLQNEIYLPSGVGTYKFYKRGAGSLWVRTIVKGAISSRKESLNCDMMWYNEDGELIAEAINVILKRSSIDLLVKYLNINLNELLYKLKWIAKSPESKEEEKGKTKANWIIFKDEKGLGDKLIKKLINEDCTCLVVERGECYRKKNGGVFEVRPDSQEDFHALSKSVFSDPQKGPQVIVYLWSLEGEKSSGDIDLNFIEQSQELNGKALLYLIQNLILSGNSSVPELWLITSDSQDVRASDTVRNFDKSITWGVGKVLVNEHPDVKCYMIDIQFNDGESDQEIGSILNEIRMNSEERQIAFRGGQRFVRRLTRVGDEDSSSEMVERLEISERGTLSNLFINSTDRQQLKPDEVEIQVKATGLNFRDIINALGLYPGDPGMLGGECSGIISAKGSDVKNINIGEEVMGIAPGSFSNYAITKAELVIPLADGMSFSESATIPIAFLTAYYGLYKLAKISKRDKILIHSASGGVGLAAVQLAQLAGAEIFATAGNDEKRDYLRSLGVKHIMNSRDLNFADEVLRLTEGKGINIVLNSLNGEYIPKSLALLAAGGSFLEIGKVDIWDEESVTQFKPDISYYKIALDELSAKGPSLVRQMLFELKERFERGELKPLRYQAFQISNAEEAFRHMMKARHIGKIVIEQTNRTGALCNSIKIDRNSSYLITGGLGALGLEIAAWLAQNGAGNLILISKDGLNGFTAEPLKKLTDKGSRVTVIRADVTNYEEMQDIFSKLDKTYPIKGIIHAAGVLDDAIIMNQKWDKFSHVLDPKVKGAINLFKLFGDNSLDFIVYFSSISSVLGSPGQANYAAANSFLDSFARYQRKLGKNAIAINWGPWKGKGMSKKLGKENAAGIKTISPKHALLVFDKILSEELTEPIVMSVDWDVFTKQAGNSQLSSIFSKFTGIREERIPEKKVIKPQLLETLEITPPSEKLTTLIEFIQGQVQGVLGLSSKSEVDTDRPLHEMGMDSLMAIEIKNRINSVIGKDLPVTAIFNYPSIRSLSEHILYDLLGMEIKKKENNADDIQDTSYKEGEILTVIEDLSEEAAEELLLKKLNELKVN